MRPSLKPVGILGSQHLDGLAEIAAGFLTGLLPQRALLVLLTH
jgi:hypothetical protein